MDAVRYWVGLILIALGVGVLLYWLSIHPFIRLWRRVGAIPTVAVHCAAMFVLAAVVIWQRDAVMVGNLGTNYVMIGLAVAVVASSIVMRRRQARGFDTRFLIGLPELDPGRYDSHLVTTGLYERMRHPRYVQLFLALLGYGLFVNYVIVYIQVVVILVVLRMVVRFEERELLDRFGNEYRDYMARVPRFIPRRADRG